jgi:hypothetical protein
MLSFIYPNLYGLNMNEVIAMAAGQPEEKDIVVRLDLGFTPEGAISGDLVVALPTMTWVTFNAMKLQPDGLYHPAGTAIVEFSGCSLIKYGAPNDQGIAEHPLYPKMEGGYEIYEVLRSSWIAELGWENSDLARHFIISFHETTFECIAHDMKMEITHDPFELVFRRIGERVFAEYC